MMNLALMLIKEVEDSDKEDIKIKTLQKVFDMCNELLTYDKSSIKAYYRRGTAYFVKKMLTEAQEDFLKVLELESQNPDAKRYLQIIKKETKKSGLKEKKIYKGIFTDSRWVEETVKDEAHQKENEAKLINDTEIWRKEMAEKEHQAKLRFEEYTKTLQDLEKGIVIDTADVSDPVTDMLLLDS
ncbi:hypothetical protein SteCoe_11410 [Stentor coeruleus]|uniref:Uncharacterized protein n=1 Tax=Stentor coeruleus TaxID=5963 RepID=A0A1R2CD87_9CILI|nr:hypothetical protein SteCoe_11410 [Stentor coeruleus]